MAVTSRTREPESKHGAASRGRPHVPLGLILVLSLTVGLAVGLAVGRGTAPEAAPPPGLAGDDALTMLQDRVDTVNSGSADDLAAFYSRDSVLEERDMSQAVVTRGADQIAAHLIAYRSMGWRLDHETTALRIGRYAAEGLRWTNGGGIVVYELDDAGKIAHTWVIGGSP